MKIYGLVFSNFDTSGSLLIYACNWCTLSLFVYRYIDLSNVVEMSMYLYI